MKIDELHDRLFEVLCTIDDICRENNIEYFLDSGTALGAVREKDFIPWDDDMDLKIYAEDLQAFLRCMKKNLPEHMHIVTPKVFAPYFYDFVVRIYDDRYPLRQETDTDRAYGNYQNRVGTDVFLFQKMPDNKMLQKLVLFRLKMLYGLGMGHRYSIPNHKKYSIVQKISVAVLTTVGRLVPLSHIYREYIRILKKWEKEDTEYRLCSNYPLTGQMLIPAKAYKKTIYAEIRGRKFPIPEGYDTELTILYGDYMTPKNDMDERVRHLDMDDAYSEEK